MDDGAVAVTSAAPAARAAAGTPDGQPQAAVGAPVALLSPGEVARLFAVNPKTVSRWARDGKISSVRTPGGHRRYLASEIEALLRSGSSEAGG
jgi:excisionase family DNA binding protein